MRLSWFSCLLVIVIFIFLFSWMALLIGVCVGWMTFFKNQLWPCCCAQYSGWYSTFRSFFPLPLTEPLPSRPFRLACTCHLGVSDFAYLYHLLAWQERAWCVSPLTDQSERHRTWLGRCPSRQQPWTLDSRQLIIYNQ